MNVVIWIAKQIRGTLAAFIYVFNLVFFSFFLIPLGIARLFCWKQWRKKLGIWMEQLPNVWVSVNSFIQNFTTATEWQVEGIEDLNYAGWYLVISNHQSWTDILVLHRIFSKKIPSLKFFLKKSLLWTLPIASWVCWFLDYPFMQRYTKKKLAENPHLKRKDTETTKKACEKFKFMPTSVVNFVEGTRFSESKKYKQNSPYRNLLRPKVGGIAFSLNVLGQQFRHILNVTIVYETSSFSLWDFLCGNIKKVIVKVEALPIESFLLGDYENNRHFRAQFQQWMNQIWHEKDALIDTLKANDHA